MLPVYATMLGNKMNLDHLLWSGYIQLNRFIPSQWDSIKIHLVACSRGMFTGGTSKIQKTKMKSLLTQE